MKHAIRRAVGAPSGLRWHHVVLVVAALLGIAALVANLFGA